MRIATLVARSAYRAVLRLYPREFRATFAAEMLAIFDLLAGEAAGPAGLLRLASRELGAGVRGVAREQGREWARRYALPLRPMQHVLLLASLLCLSLIAGLYALLDFAAAISRYWQATSLALLIGGSLGALVVWEVPRRRSLVALALFVIAVSGVGALDWNTRKPFLRQFDQVRPGMTVAEVDRLMAGSMREPRTPGADGPQRVLIYRHTNEGWGDSDWGEVLFERGKVVEVRFLPD